ncbi:MAG: hypothetical protein MUF72_23235 [Elainella sp. Prado103]|nr:hypothetical protein [Elainella sp. Prado103]
MQQGVLEDLLYRKHPQKVVIETCTNSNWVHDICQKQKGELDVELTLLDTLEEQHDQIEKLIPIRLLLFDDKSNC